MDKRERELRLADDIRHAVTQNERGLTTDDELFLYCLDRLVQYGAADFSDIMRMLVNGVEEGVV